MDTKFNASDIEDKLYAFWEERGYFSGRVKDPQKKSFSIVLPPPNANADLHLGHAMYVYEDVMIRYHLLKGQNVLWLAGADHAGIETQFVYEKHLKKQGKSRFDFDRETLFTDIWAFVMKNRDTMENQLKKLGFALDWSKRKFTMDEDIVQIVYKTFKDLFDQGYAYRANKLVNYCTSCGTSFSDLEVTDKEVEGLLYHIRYPIVGGGEIVIATTRPETLYGDVAVMVNPKDKRYLHLRGKKAILPITKREVPIIFDEYVDAKFGTGAVKVTPYHDFNDFEVALRHNLPKIQIIGFDGKLINTGIVDGLRVKSAREETVKKLTESGLLVSTTPHHLVQKTCYRCGTVLEPLPKEQWFIKVKSLASEAVKLVETDEIAVHPKRFKKQLVRILEQFIDWNVSRQIVWGIRIPAYRCMNLSDSKTHDDQSVQTKWFVSIQKPTSCQICRTCAFVQDEDTFDTWFSSAQWPFATIQTCDSDSVKNFYPTSVMETGYDILRAWVARMIMIGYFETKKVPFKDIFLHGMVRDKFGQKMSKSKGNVINPLEMITKYGADSLRAALIFGTQEGGDVVLSEQKIVGMRNFGNKLWNMGRFIFMNKSPVVSPKRDTTSEEIKAVLSEMDIESQACSKKYHYYCKQFAYAKAFDLVYEYAWHRFADYYIERLKAELQGGNIEVYSKLEKTYKEILRHLHPYMPYVTEAIWQELHGSESSILDVQ